MSLDLQTPAAVSGIGQITFVFHVLMDLSLIVRKFVLLLVINVNHTIQMVPVLLVSKVMILLMALAYSNLRIIPNPQIQAVLFGNGTFKDAKFAQRTGSLTQTKSVFQSAINVKLSILMANVLPVIKATISSKVNVFSPQQTLPNHQTLAAKPSTGVTKFVLSAPKTMYLIAKKSAFLSVINAKLMITMAYVLRATKDMI